MKWFGRSLRGERTVSWLSIALLIVPLYPISIGPACWISMRLDPWKHRQMLSFIGRSYAPIVSGLLTGPRPVKDAVDRYIELGAPAGISVTRGDYSGIRWDGPGYNFTFRGH